MKPYHLHFTLQGLPATTNSMGRKHWSVKAAEARNWKTWVVFAVGSKRPCKPLERAKLTLVRYSSGELDFDGLVSSFKHVIDGLKQAKVIADDKYSNIGQPTYLPRKTAPKRGYIEVTVEEVA